MLILTLKRHGGNWFLTPLQVSATAPVTHIETLVMKIQRA
jgi:hypothetical protein